MPVSSTPTTISSPCWLAQQITFPDGVNFTALEIRFTTTWINLSRSPLISGRLGSINFSSSKFFCSNNDVVAAMALSMISCMETLSRFHSILPASILARSNTSLIKLVKRSPSEITTSRFSETWPMVFLVLGSDWLVAGNIFSSSLFLMIFAKPKTEVSGVLNSWLTVERNALFAWLALSAIWLASSACCLASVNSSNNCALRKATPTEAAMVESKRSSFSLNRFSLSVLCILNTPIISSPTGMGTPKYEAAGTPIWAMPNSSVLAVTSLLINKGLPDKIIFEVSPLPSFIGVSVSPYM